MAEGTEKHSAQGKSENSLRASRQLDSRYGCLDLEINRAGQIYDIGALLDGKTFSRHCRGKSSTPLRELDAFLAPAEVLLGHNLLGHDLPALRTLQPDLALLRKPVIDTLYLSPLAFPENPYHRLVKDYKLVRDAVNDPVADARLAAELFADQEELFARLRQQEPGNSLTLCKQENRLLLLSANRPVAALSKTASTHWADRTECIISIQVVAMIRRSAGDGDPAYKPRYHTDQWEVPLVEIAHRV